MGCPAKASVARYRRTAVLILVTMSTHPRTSLVKYADWGGLIGSIAMVSCLIMVAASAPTADQTDLRRIHIA